MNKKAFHRIIKNPLFIFLFIDKCGLHFLDDKTYLQLMFKYQFDRKLNLENVHSYNEKLQWLKLYDRKKHYTKMVDKYDVKQYVREMIGEEFVVPTIGVFDKFEDIDFNRLPKEFVIKTTHYGGGEGVFLIKDKDKINIKKMKRILKKILKRNLYYYGREWPYKKVKPRIIIEKYMKDNTDNDVKDYKFFCFNGIPKIMYISEGSTNHDTHKICYFDMDYNQLSLKRSDYRDFETIPEKPKNFEKMKFLASTLAEGIPHIRVDFYEINGQVYFSEFTFYTGSGYIPFEDEEWDKQLGDWIELPIID